MSPPAPPDPSHGLFETMLIAGGRPVELVAHLGRLTASARELFGAELPAELPGDLVRACAGIELGRVRIDVVPDGASELRYEIKATAIDPSAFFPDWERGERLRSVGAEGWSGAHKWSDRRWLENAERELGEEVPLLVDADGYALEAGRANLFIVVDGALATPPVDGRILPGTARAATLEIAADLEIEASERPLALSELGEADEVFLTSSVKGLRPVRWLDGVELSRRSTLVERLAAELRQRWLGNRATPRP
ncbi:MAG: aminotransferase class IV [Solirubrobacterales bacterium]